MGGAKHQSKASRPWSLNKEKISENLGDQKEAKRRRTDKCNRELGKEQTAKRLHG